MEDEIELVAGSGNVYRDFGRPNADLEQARAIVAARIVKILDGHKLSTREAAKLTGIGHSEFSRIRNARLTRFTLDRLILILGRMDGTVQVGVTLKKRKDKTATPAIRETAA
jgi:predicted XRE-type DNA-binding protein